jgi:hypothetical protein
MATTGGVIGKAGTPLDIKLGESPNIDDPILAVEFQQVYNALHILSSYMAILRETLESSDGQTPAESVRFRRTFWAPAGQAIAVGAVVSCFDGAVFNGVYSKGPPIGGYEDSAITIGSTGNRAFFNLVPISFGIALTAANPGEPVRVGIGPGVLQFSGAKSGQLIWGVDAQSVYTERAANNSTQIYSGVRHLVNNGGVYLQNVTAQYYIPNPTFTYYNWEGYWLPGYPNNSGGTYQYDRAFLYPIGVCVTDNYVMFSDYKRSDPIPLRTI